MSNSAFHPFAYDPFQQRAIEAIDQGKSLFVAAPTGAGKTVLADYVIERAFERRERVIYTAPVKALSNQKFRDFTTRHGEQVGIIPPPGCQPTAGARPTNEISSPGVRRPTFGGTSQMVGIMTGDVTINRTAPLIIMTTEIYRNTLLEDVERLSSYAWIIFDEIHYLDDVERGTVWEEALLLTPAHMRLLCLSATIPNVQELAQWIRTIHAAPVEVVEETHRPVPLTFQFQCQNMILKDLPELKQRGYQGRQDWHLHDRSRYGRIRRLPLHANRIDKLVHELQERQQLPCIFFTFGRRRAEDLAWEISGLPLLSPEEHLPLRRMFRELCERFQLTQDRTAEALGHLIDRGVAYHHAGMLPTMKEVIERCFTSRLLKLIVTTETFALGINMPARSVVLDALNKRSDTGFSLLRRREFLQMAGRAGRRGMDEAGFVYLRVNPTHVTLDEIAHLLSGTPEPIHSRFNTSYATLLNLYRRHGPALMEIFPKTLYYFQTSGARRHLGLELMQRKLDLLASMGYLTPKALTPKGEFASWVYGYELLLTELHARERLERLDPLSLAMLIVAIVYEPKPRALPPRPHRLSKQLAHLCAEPLAKIHKEELRYRIAPKTKSTAFQLSHAIEAWMSRAPFANLTKLCAVDEGEIVRYFRMSVQLLRQLAESPASNPRLQDISHKALVRINRDVVDAEAQLRMG